MAEVRTMPGKRAGGSTGDGSGVARDSAVWSDV